MRVRVVLRLGSTVLQPPLPFGLLAAPPRPWRGLVGSVCLHAGLAGILSFAQDRWRPDPLDSYLTSSPMARLVPLRLHADPPPVSPLKTGAATKVELAKAPAADNRIATVLQPDSEKAAVRRLPPLFYWAERQRIRRDKVLSASWKRPEAPPALTAKPALTAPIREAPGEHNMSSASAVETPALPLSAGSEGMPLRDPRFAHQTRAPGSSEAGDAVNALVLAPAEVPADVILLPPGSNSGNVASQGAGISTGLRAGSTAESGAVEIAGTRALHGNLNEQFTPADYVIAEHPPDSRFDIITTHSSSTDALPDAEVALSGAPVYTAYISVGFGREWLFQYCLTGSSREADQDGRFINLSAAQTIQAPFPTFTVLPKAHSNPVSAYAVVHAILGRDGRLTGINIRGLLDQTYVARLVLALSAWRFRPVLLNAQAVEAEILMGIPRLSN